MTLLQGEGWRETKVVFKFDDDLDFSELEYRWRETKVVFK